MKTTSLPKNFRDPEGETNLYLRKSNLNIRINIIITKLFIISIYIYRFVL